MIVIVAVPFNAPAVTVLVPFVFPDTVTTFVLLDFQETMESPLFRPETFSTVVFCFVFKRSEVTEVFIYGVNFFP